MESGPNPFEALFERQGAYFWKVLKQTSANERIAKLRKLKKWLFAHQQDIRDALFQDMRKPAHEADLMEFLPVVAETKDAIANLREWMRPKHVGTPMALIGTSTVVSYEPKGRALVLAPWNFPFQLTLGPMISAIAAGCTLMVKPSEFCPATTALIGKLIQDLFLEEEVALCDGDHVVAQQLTALPFDHIFFTGSPEVGRLVMKAAAEHLCSVTLELGGRNTVVVDESANIADTARKLIWGKFVNAGQSCMSPNIVMVHAKVHDKLLEALKKAYNSAFGAHVGNMQGSPDYCGIIHSRHQSMLQDLLQSAVEAGAKILEGGKGDTAKSYLDPTILSDVQPGNPILDKEIFGPILPIMRYDDLNEAIRFIRKNQKPLAMYIFSRSEKAIEQLQMGTSSGCFMINETTIAFGHTEIPFGGVNWSGIGKAHGHAGFLAFSNEKPVMRQSTLLPSTLLAQAPYATWKNKLLNLVIRWF